jgi:hypothetical protein
MEALRTSADRYMNADESCQAAATNAMPNMAMLVREKRVTRTRTANSITTAAVRAAGTA